MNSLKSKIKNACGIVAILIILAMPILSFAEPSGGSGVVSQPGGGYGAASGFSIQNPLKYGTVSALIKGISGYLIGFGASVATLMVLWGAFQILTAGGDAKGYEKGKDTVMYAAIGLGILLLAGGIGSLVSDLLGGGTGSGSAPTGGAYTPLISGSSAQSPYGTGINVYGAGDLPVPAHYTSPNAGNAAQPASPAQSPAAAQPSIKTSGTNDLPVQ